MCFSRDRLAVSLFRDLRARVRDRLIQRGIVPQRADGVVPGLDFVFGREAGRLLASSSQESAARVRRRHR